MRRSLFLAPALLAIGVMAGCTQPRPDSEIVAEVRQDLREGDVPGTIAVEITNGSVALNGSVPTEKAREQAEDIADDVSGVTQVTNNLRVVAGDAPASQPIRPMAPGAIPPAPEMAPVAPAE
jgi:hypothetical protein